MPVHSSRDLPKGTLNRILKDAGLKQIGDHDMLVSYPARFYKDEDAVGVEFPDLPGCLTFGNTFEDAVFYAADVLELFLRDYPEPFPVPSDPDVIPTDADSCVRLVTAEVTAVRKAM